MYAPLPSALRPARVLFLSRSESSVRTDIKTLRGIGVKTLSHFSDSAEALAFLGDSHESAAGLPSAPAAALPGVDLVVCDEQLADMPASAFLYAMSQRKHLRTLPVLVLTGSVKTAKALRAAGLYVLERPYTQEQMQNMVQKAMSPLRRALRPEAFAAAAERKDLPLEKARPKPRKRDETGPMTTSDWYAKAVEHLNNKQLESAEFALAKTLERQEDHIDAWLVLAKVCRLQNNARGVRRALVRAAAASLRGGGDKTQADSIVSLLPEAWRDNVFVHEAISLMHEDKFRQAALSFLDAERHASGVPLHRIIARACLLTPRPEACMTKLCNSFEGLGHKDTAIILRKRLLAYTPFTPSGKPSWLDKFPLLKEAVCVASYTAWVWKQA